MRAEHARRAKQAWPCEFASRNIASDCDHDVCITCGDVAVEMHVLRLEGDLAVCEAADGDVRTVEVALVDGVAEGDTLLVHADVALARSPGGGRCDVAGPDAPRR